MTDIRKEPTNFADDVSSVEPFKALVEVNIIEMIVVAFCEHQLMFSWWETELCESAVNDGVLRRIIKWDKDVVGLHDAVDNWNFGTRDVIHYDIACVVRFIWGVGEKKNVATVKCLGLRRLEILCS